MLPKKTAKAVAGTSLPVPPPKKGDRYRVAARWSEKLAKRGFVPVVADFLEQYHALKPYPLTHSEAMFIVHLMSYKWDESAPYPGYKTIAKKMGISHKSARRYAQSLEQKGYLRRQVRVGATNRFELKALVAAVEKKADELVLKAKEANSRRELSSYGYEQE